MIQVMTSTHPPRFQIPPEPSGMAEREEILLHPQTNKSGFHRYVTAPTLIMNETRRNSCRHSIQTLSPGRLDRKTLLSLNGQPAITFILCPFVFTLADNIIECQLCVSIFCPWKVFRSAFSSTSAHGQFNGRCPLSSSLLP